MRAVVQRVAQARVTVDGAAVGAIGPGLCVLLGVAAEDTADGARRLARRLTRLRIFEDDDARLDRSVRDIHGEVLVVSQFTLIADTAKGNRPSFARAAEPVLAEALYRLVIAELEREAIRVESGRFGARMQVDLRNDGPVTIILET